jgi:hypothetical protein
MERCGLERFTEPFSSGIIVNAKRRRYIRKADVNVIPGMERSSVSLAASRISQAKAFAGLSRAALPRGERGLRRKVEKPAHLWSEDIILRCA